MSTSIITTLEAQFAQFDAKAEEYRAQSMAIVVRDESDRDSMKAARDMRLKLKNIRVDAEKLRKQLKADALEYGRAVDGAYKRIENVIAPCEDHLKAQEEYVARLEVERKQKLIDERNAQLAEYGAAGMVANIGDLPEEQWSRTLETYRLAHTARIEQEKRNAEEQAARAAEETAERERFRIENEKLRAEAEAARKERERIEAEMVEQRRLAEEAAIKERAERERVEEELRAKQRAEAEAAEQSRLATEKAAAAPDAEKILAFAETLRGLDLPLVTTPSVQKLVNKIAAELDALIDRIETAAKSI